MRSEVYLYWIRRFIVFFGKRHPRELGAPEVTEFLSHLAVEGGVAAATQNQALAALLFLYKEVMRIDTADWVECRCLAAAANPPRRETQ